MFLLFHLLCPSPITDRVWKATGSLDSQSSTEEHTHWWLLNNIVSSDTLCFATDLLKSAIFCAFSTFSRLDMPVAANSYNTGYSLVAVDTAGC